MSKNRCPICLSFDTSFYFISPDIHGRLILSKDTYNLHQCHHCQTFFLPTSTNKINKKQSYPHEYFVSNHHPILNKLATLLAKYSIYQKQNSILKHTQPISKIKILDVGAGSGSFLQFLNPKLFVKSGLDINQNSIKICQELGIKMYAKDLRKLNIVNKFDCISLWHVIEHTKNPRSLISKIHSCLKSKGIFILSFPNTRSFGYKIGQTNWFHLDTPRHLFLPNQASMELVLKKTGFKIISVYSEFYDYPLDLFWSIRKSSWKYLIYLLYPIIKFFDRETITLVCQKK